MYFPKIEIRKNETILVGFSEKNTPKSNSFLGSLILADELLRCKKKQNFWLAKIVLYIKKMSYVLKKMV